MFILGLVVVVSIAEGAPRRRRVHSRPAVYGCSGRCALGGGAIYTIRRVAALREVSLVALPAYPATTASMAAAARPETAARQRCREAMEKMRRAAAAAE